MLIAGKWQVGDDGVLRPLVRAAVSGIDGRLVADDFLIDSGADRTVLSAALLARLSLPTRSAPSGSTLSGIGGGCAFVLVTSAVEFIREDGGAVRVRGEFAGFTDPTATDVSILGRDVLNRLDILFRGPQQEVVIHP